MTITLELNNATIGKAIAKAFSEATGATGKWSCTFHVKDGAFHGATLNLSEHPAAEVKP